MYTSVYLISHYTVFIKVQNINNNVLCTMQNDLLNFFFFEKDICDALQQNREQAPLFLKHCGIGHLKN